MADPIQDTSTASDICVLVDDNAQVQRTMVQNFAWTANGQLTQALGNSGTRVIAAPYVVDYAITGCLPTMLAAPTALTVQVTSGTFQKDAIAYLKGSTTTSVLANGDATNPRIDVISLDVAGAIVVTAGTPAATPTVPTAPTANLKIAEVWVPANSVAASTGAAAASLTPFNFLEQPVAVGRVTGDMAYWDATAKRFLPRAALELQSGANLPMFSNTIQVGGSKVIANSHIKNANSKIFIQRSAFDANAGHIFVTAIGAGTFTVASTDALDGGAFDYFIINAL